MAEGGDALEELARSRQVARAAAETLFTQQREAESRGDIRTAEKLSAARSDALSLVRSLTTKIQTGIIRPGGNVPSLKQATEELEERIERMNQTIADLQDARAVLSILTSLVSIVSAF
ncbi:MAG TPA: hypothetical protein VMS43_13235 [Allosphingosinicella sp.]|nr:hypothetical protein [Allosphingosinicella sp.]